jgi:hypothetical protein
MQRLYNQLYSRKEEQLQMPEVLEDLKHEKLTLRHEITNLKIKAAKA